MFISCSSYTYSLEAFTHSMIDTVYYQCHLYGNMMVVKHVGNGKL